MMEFGPVELSLISPVKDFASQAEYDDSLFVLAYYLAKYSGSLSVAVEIIEKKDLAGKNIDEKTGVLLAALAVQASKLGDSEKEYAVDAILDGRLKSTDQVAGKSQIA